MQLFDCARFNWVISMIPMAPINQHSRRNFLAQAGAGAGMLAYAAMAAADGARGISATHFAPRAKRVIWLFMHGGPSHVDLFDPKPALTKYGGKPLPQSFGEVMTRREVAKNPLLAPVRRFRPRGESGLEISDFLPQIAECADDLTLIRSMTHGNPGHDGGMHVCMTGHSQPTEATPYFGSVLSKLKPATVNMPSYVWLQNLAGATLFHALGIPPDTRFGPDGFSFRVSDGEPVQELFA